MAKHMFDNNKALCQMFSCLPQSQIINVLINTTITTKHEIFKHSLIANSASLALGGSRAIYIQLASATNRYIIYEIESELFNLIKFILATMATND